MLLLLVLALLAMFGLIAVAFVVISGQAQRSAKSIERMGLSEDASTGARPLLQQAAMQVFRGSTNPASVMGAHRLLEEMYGTNWYVGKITNTPTVVAGQLIEFTYQVSSNGAWDPTSSGGSWIKDPNPNAPGLCGDDLRRLGGGGQRAGRWRQSNQLRSADPRGEQP